MKKDDIRKEAQLAAAIVYGRGSGMSLLELMVLMLEEGLPSRVEREKIRAEHMQKEERATPPSSPS